jgi:hypothetical protein
MTGRMPRMAVVEDRMQRTDCSWTEGRVSSDGRGSTSGKHEGRLWASLGSLERPKDFKDTETTHLSGDRYIFFQRHGHL